MKASGIRPLAVLASSCLFLNACGGGGGNDSGGPPQAPPYTSVPLARVTAASPFTAGCDSASQSGTLYTNAEVEPSVAINPTSSANLIGAWQQNRWSSGGSQGLLIGASFDGGHNWTIGSAAFSHCTGGTAANGGDYERATDPWIAISPNGAAYVLALSFTGATLSPGSSSAMLVSRSVDGGVTWGASKVLIADGAAFFNDKGAITADSTNSNFVYAVWDRLSTANDGPTYMARTTDGGATWEAARNIYNPGTGNQTLANQILSLPSGVLVNVFNEIDVVSGGGVTTTIRVIRSLDRGVTWSAPIDVADSLAVGASDPETHAAVRDGSDVPAATVDSNGGLYIVWQDARFSGGARDAIAFVHSTDGGLTWSAPAAINTVATVPAFTPTVHVRGDGVIGVTYYDFRHNTTNAGTLPTDLWLLTSTDGTTWQELHISGPFDLSRAPTAGGLFLGDYQALTSAGTEFLPFFVQTNAGVTNNRTDVFTAFSGTMASAHEAAPAPMRTIEAASGGPVEMTDAWRQRVEARIRRTLAQRLNSTRR